MASLNTTMDAAQQRESLLAFKGIITHGVARRLASGLEFITFSTFGDETHGDTVTVTGQVRDSEGNAVTSKRRLRLRITSPAKLNVTTGTVITGTDDTDPELVIDTDATGAFVVECKYAAGALAAVFEIETIAGNAQGQGPLPVIDVATARKNVTFT